MNELIKKIKRSSTKNLLCCGLPQEILDKLKRNITDKHHLKIGDLFDFELNKKVGEETIRLIHNDLTDKEYFELMKAFFCFVRKQKNQLELSLKPSEAAGINRQSFN